MDEIWKDIKGYEGLYQVSNLGRVKNIKRGKIKKQSISHAGYCRVSLNKGNKLRQHSVHRLVAIAFIDCDNYSLQINHKNGIKKDNKFDNLEWVTGSYNVQDSYDRLNTLGIQKIVLDINTGVYYNSICEASRYVGIPHRTLNEMLNGVKENKTSLIKT